MEAFESHDIDRLVTLLAEDATTSMPPVPWWLQGREAIGRLMKAGDARRGARIVPTVANGQPAFGQYRQGAASIGPSAWCYSGQAGNGLSR